MLKSSELIVSHILLQTIGKVTRALGSALNKQQNLEKTKSYELSQLTDNTATLKQLIEQGKTVENNHAQQVCVLNKMCQFSKPLSATIQQMHKSFAMKRSVHRVHVQCSLSLWLNLFYVWC